MTELIGHAGQADNLIGGNGDDTIALLPDKVWSGGSLAYNSFDTDPQSPGAELVPLDGRARFFDFIDGGAGHDTILGTDGPDAISFDDELTQVGSLGTATNRIVSIETIIAGAGDDLVDLSGDTGNYYTTATAIWGNDGNDVLWGGARADTIEGGSGTDRLRGGLGDDRLAGGEDGDLVWGGVGNDQAFGNSGDDGIDGGAGHDRLWGGAGNDLLLGNDGADVLYGNTGADLLRGDNGNDTLFGGTGADRLDGGGGNDRIDGGGGSDRLEGGTGRDTFVFALASNQDGVTDNDLVVDFQHGLDKLDLSALGSDPIASSVEAAGDTLITLAKGDQDLIVVAGVTGLGLGDYIFAT